MPAEEERPAEEEAQEAAEEEEEEVADQEDGDEAAVADEADEQTGDSEGLGKFQKFQFQVTGVTQGPGASGSPTPGRTSSDLKNAVSSFFRRAQEAVSNTLANTSLPSSPLQHVSRSKQLPDKNEALRKKLHGKWAQCLTDTTKELQSLGVGIGRVGEMSQNALRNMRTANDCLERMAAATARIGYLTSLSFGAPVEAS
eukprot:tig00021179_g19241.t1